jgi:hypothetical protein
MESNPPICCEALMLLKLYCAKSVLATLAGARQKSVDEKTFRKWSWLFVEKINHLKYRVILFENHFRGSMGNICLILWMEQISAFSTFYPFGRVGSLTCSRDQAFNTKWLSTS